MAIISNATTIADAGAFSTSLGALTLIKDITLSSAASTIDFVNGASSVVFDGTYPVYKFEFINMHPATENSTNFTFQADVGTGTSYAQTITSTFIQIRHEEGDGATQLAYSTAGDQAQATGFQQMFRSLEGDNDSSICGELYVFNPSSTTFVKHFIGQGFGQNAAPAAFEAKIGGYFNTTTALTRMRFKMSTGNIDSGAIKLYGIKDS